MTTWLEKLRIRRVALVDAGANQEASVELFKRGKDMAEDKVATLEKRLAELQAEKESLATEMKEAQSRLEALGDAAKPDPIAKADPEVRKRMEELEKRNREQEDRIAKFEADRERDLFIRKAAVYPLIGAAEDLAKPLQVLSKGLTEDEYNSFVGNLGTLHARLEESKLFDEVGTAEAMPVGTAQDKLEKLAKAAQAENPGMSYATAFTKVVNTPDGKKLYAEQLKDRGVR